MSGSAAASPSGFLLIDKPLGMTSMVVCASVRRRLVAGGAPTRVKVGHGGTLDPLATGLLVVLVGKYTKLCQAIMAGRKRYLAEIDLSVTSPTHDLEAPTTPVEVARPPERGRVEEVVRGFVGVIQQSPPAFSAVWVEGERAYHMAREGRAPELKPRPVTVYGIDVLGYEWPVLRLDVSCGKGTYIRSLARDIGAALGTGGTLTALRRTESGGLGEQPFRVEDATPLDDLPRAMTQADLRVLSFTTESTENTEREGGKGR